MELRRELKQNERNWNVCGVKSIMEAGTTFIQIVFTKKNEMKEQGRKKEKSICSTSWKVKKKNFNKRYNIVVGVGQSSSYLFHWISTFINVDFVVCWMQCDILFSLTFVSFKFYSLVRKISKEMNVHHYVKNLCDSLLHDGR